MISSKIGKLLYIFGVFLYFIKIQLQNESRWLTNTGAVLVDLILALVLTKYK